MKELDKRGGKLDVGTEKDVGPLGKVPQREECPICMLVLPLHEALQSYHVCCGNTICGGCDIHHQMKSGERRTCAFCRTAPPKTDEEIFARTLKRAELKDPDALLSMAMDNGYGRCGLPVDQAKCIDLLRESAGLGCSTAQFQLGNHHDNGEMGLERNKEEALKYWKEAAEGGDVHARHNLACGEWENGDHVAAMRHFRLAASAGYRKSMHNLILCFELGFFHHSDLAETLKAMYFAKAEMKSKGRAHFIDYLKRTGEYKEEYGM